MFTTRWRLAVVNLKIKGPVSGHYIGIDLIPSNTKASIFTTDVYTLKILLEYTKTGNRSEKSRVVLESCRIVGYESGKAPNCTSYKLEVMEPEDERKRRSYSQQFENEMIFFYFY